MNFEITKSAAGGGASTEALFNIVLCTSDIKDSVYEQAEGECMAVVAANNRQARIFEGSAQL